VHGAPSAPSTRKGKTITFFKLPLMQDSFISSISKIFLLKKAIWACLPNALLVKFEMEIKSMPIAFKDGAFPLTSKEA